MPSPRRREAGFSYRGHSKGHARNLPRQNINHTIGLWLRNAPRRFALADKLEKMRIFVSKI
jgi:hypothetical protein